MRFVLVNGRTPRPQSFCSWCCEPISDRRNASLYASVMKEGAAPEIGLGLKKVMTAVFGTP